MNKFLTGTVLSAVIFVWGCGAPEEKRNIDSLTWELEIVDSIQIATLEDLELMSVQAEKDLFLFSVFGKSTQMILTNSSGEILRRLDVPKDAPNGFGGLCAGAIFMGDTIIIQGRQGVYLYDLEFNFLKGLKRPYPLHGMFYSGFDHLYFAETFAGPSLVSFSGNPQTDFPSNQKGYYENYNAFDLIPLGTEEFKPTAPLHPDSRYLKSGEAFNFISLAFSLAGNKLTYAHQADTLLYDLDLNDPQLKQKSMRIPFDKFVLKSGFPYGDEEDYMVVSDSPGKLDNILKVGDLDLITYYSGLKKENFPSLDLGREQYQREIDRMNPQKWMVRNSKDQFSEHKLFPKKYRLGRADTQNRIWAMQNVNELEEEPEVITLYQLKLVQK